MGARRFRRTAPSSAGPTVCEYLFISLGPYDKLDPDEFPPPLGRWDDPSTWVDGYPQVLPANAARGRPAPEPDAAGGAVTLIITPSTHRSVRRCTASTSTAPLDPATRDELLAAIDEHLLLVFRNARLPTEQQVVDFCESFGPLRPRSPTARGCLAIPASTGSRTVTPTVCRAPVAPTS